MTQKRHKRAGSLLLTVLVLPFWVQCGTSEDDETGTPRDSESDTQNPVSDTASDTPPDTSPDTASDTTLDPSQRPASLRGPCPLKAEYGAFNFTYTDRTTGIEGRVRNGYLGSISDEVDVVGDCRLVQKRAPVCDPACESGDLCDVDNNCVPYPTNQNVGDVTVLGAVDDIVMSPTNISNLYFNTTLTSPPFSPNDELTLTVDGGDAQPFYLFGTGIPLIETTDAEWVVSRDTPITINWTAGNVDDAFVTVFINIDQHGVSPASISCESEDTGSLTIPADMVNALIDLGISGKPSSVLSRRTVDSTQTDFSCVSFTVESTTSVSVRME